jgi:predicted DNA-binding transcriptional regulator AlpA
MPDPIDTRRQRVTLKTRRGVLHIGPNGRIDGLWKIVQRELRTNQQVREMCGGIERSTLIRWRADPEQAFPQPVITFKSGGKPLDLWSRTEIEEWLKQR